MHTTAALVVCSLAVLESAAGDSKQVGVVYKEGSKTAVKAGDDKDRVLKLLEGKSKAEVKTLLDKLKKATGKKTTQAPKPPAPAPAAKKQPRPPAPPKAQASAEAELDKNLNKLAGLVDKKPLPAATSLAQKKTASATTKASGQVTAKKSNSKQDLMDLLKKASPSEIEALKKKLQDEGKAKQDDDISEEVSLIADDPELPPSEEDEGDDEEIASNFDDELALIENKNLKNSPKRTIPIGADFSPDFAEDFDSADYRSTLSEEERYFAEEQAARAAQESWGSTMQFYLFVLAIGGVAATLFYYRDSPTPAWAKHILDGELSTVTIPGFSPEIDKKAKQSLLGVPKASEKTFKEASALDDFGLTKDVYGGYGGLSTGYGDYGGLSTGAGATSAPPARSTCAAPDIEEFGL